MNAINAHAPLMFNIEATASFTYPSDGIADIELRDHVKVILWGEWLQFIWLEVVMKSSSYWIGQCKSKLLFGSIKPGDLLKFHPCNIYEICKHEEE